MKLIKCLFLFVVVLSATEFTLAQTDDNPCRLILQNGLYRTYDIKKSENFAQDFKEYFISDKFASDFRSGKWQGSLFTIIKGSPTKLNAGASNEEIRTAQESVRQGSSFSLDQSFYESVKVSIPDAEIAERYNDCIKNLPLVVGFRVVPSVSEKDVLFVVTYKKISSTDPMPTVTLFQVKNGTNVVRSFKDGGLLQDSNTISADRDPNKDLSLILETDKGVVTYRVPADPTGFNKDIPVGTIITSYLNWSEFQNVSQNNLNNPNGNVWSSRYSKWSPADGREVPNSGFLRATSQTLLPDLRGMFLRGLNQFDPQESSTVASDRKDPDNRIRGSFQANEFKKHDHHFAESRNQTTKGGDSTSYGANGGGDLRTDKEVVKPGGNETRPNNIAVYYYIRIN